MTSLEPDERPSAEEVAQALRLSAAEPQAPSVPGLFPQTSRRRAKHIGRRRGRTRFWGVLVGFSLLIPVAIWIVG